MFTLCSMNLVRVLNLGLLVISLYAVDGDGFLLDGLNLRLLPRGVRNAMEAMDLVFVRLYSRSNGWRSRFIGPRDTPALMHAAGWNPELPTLVLVHGFSESPEAGCVPTILEAFRQTSRDVNLVVLDWSSLAAGPWYYTAYNNADYVALSMARALDFLAGPGGAAPEDIHLVGCGLGARVAARAADNVTMQGKIGRITGLDPWFGRSKRERQLPTRVARFVDAVHTDSGVHGHSVSVGHADFFPNGGISPQPGCELSNVFRGNNAFSTALCSHIRSYQYFAESIRNPRAFLATPCDSWDDYHERRCAFGDAAMPMGYGTPLTARGKFYLDTRRPRSHSGRPNTINLGNRDNSALHVIESPNLGRPQTQMNPPRQPYEQYGPMKTSPQTMMSFSDHMPNQSLASRMMKSKNQYRDNKVLDKGEVPKKSGMREARLWSQPGVNTLASFVRLAELNLS
ncbi:hypothetical protein B566_EDAN005331 [Ephemera danica]|nr:hypothetical protein B566_EDAN005331 [Ephemera danica]